MVPRGAEGGQGERDDNDDRDRRCEQAAEGLGDDLVAGLLDPARAVDGKKDGNDGAGVRRLREFEAKQVDGCVRRHDGGDGRIHQDAAKKDGGHRVNIEALCRGVSKKHRDEVEQRVGHRVEDRIRGRVVGYHARDLQKRQDALEDADGDEQVDDREEERRQQVDDRVDAALERVGRLFWGLRGCHGFSPF